MGTFFRLPALANSGGSPYTPKPLRVFFWRAALVQRLTAG